MATMKPRDIILLLPTTGQLAGAQLLQEGRPGGAAGWAPTALQNLFNSLTLELD